MGYYEGTEWKDFSTANPKIFQSMSDYHFLWGNAYYKNSGIDYNDFGERGDARK